MNSTPWTPVSTMRLTALLPPPPTPTILTSVKPRAGDSRGASTICGTTDTGAGQVGHAVGVEAAPLATIRHVSQSPHRPAPDSLDRSFGARVVEHRCTRRASLEDLAVGADFGANTRTPQRWRRYSATWRSSFSRRSILLSRIPSTSSRGFRYRISSMLSSSICKPCNEKKRASVGMMTLRRGDQRVDGQHAQRRRRVDHDVVVAARRR